MEPLDVLAIMAHPDDAELLCGGALIRSSDRGDRTGVVDLTDGEMGSRGSREVRRKEKEEASAVLGLSQRRSAGLPDANLRNTREARLKVAGLIRELRPRVVVTHWKEGRHPDHREACELVYDASFLAGLKNLEVAGTPHRPRSVVHAVAYRDDAPPPSFVVDITDTLERKLEALRCYRSQFEGAHGVGEVFPGGDRPFLEQVKRYAARSGARIRVAFGEPFQTREALALPSLSSLSVPTF